jgi:aspartate aminotransferase-like enzyme
VRQMGAGDLTAGRDALVKNAELASAMTRAGVQALGLRLFAPAAPASALTAVHSPTGFDSGVLIKEFRDRFSAVVANGQGDQMKGKLFRIAHIGYYDYIDTIGILAALEQVLANVTGKPVEFGAAVRAAQEVYSGSLANAVRA